MQSIKNAVFGSSENTETQSGSEPISGKTGTEAYDAGNEAGQSGTTGEYKSTTDNPEVTSATTETTDSKPIIDYRPDTSTEATNTEAGAGASTSGITGDSTGAAEKPITDTTDYSSSGAGAGASTSGTTGVESSITEPSTTKDDSAASALKDTSGPTDEPDVAIGTNAGGAVEPSVSAKPDSGAAPEVEHQGSDKPTDEPTGEQHEAVVSEKKIAEDAMDKGSSGPSDPSDTSGQPLGQSDDAGVGGPPAAEGEEEEGPKAKSKGTGTGTQYVKSTGVAAEGGDFDAAKPGAGKEADRLMEQAGIKKSSDNDGEPAVDPFADSSDKSGLASKIKDKLHIGKD